MQGREGRPDDGRGWEGRKQRREAWRVEVRGERWGQGRAPGSGESAGSGASAGGRESWDLGGKAEAGRSRESEDFGG